MKPANATKGAARTGRRKATNTPAGIKAPAMKGAPARSIFMRARDYHERAQRYRGAPARRSRATENQRRAARLRRQGCVRRSRGRGPFGLMPAQDVLHAIL